MPCRRAHLRAPTRLLAVVLAHFVLSAAVAQAADPNVPPGRDPGGAAVAIIGGGLDYRREEFAARLARDGEGELIGWDFVDEDRRPFASAGGVDTVAAIVVRESAARLVPLRIAPGVERQIVQALRMSGETPSHVVLLVAEPGQPIERQNLVLAAQQLPRLLIVVPARLVAPETQSVRGPDDAGGLLVVSGPTPSPSADLSVDASREPEALDAARSEKTHPDDVAAAKIAALAARLIAREAVPTARAHRARLLGMARSGPGAAKIISGVEKLP